MKEIMGFDIDKAYDYEHGFYLTSSIVRLAKLLTHYELYKMIIHLPGHVIECGVFKAATFLQWATFREMLENPYSRKIIGFDTFGKFPDAQFPDDQKFRNEFVQKAGEWSISVDDLKKSCERKNIINFELIKGDINQTVPRYVSENPHLKISLLHIDTDLYEPSKTVLSNLYSKVVAGGIIVLDDYGTFPGGTKAIDEFLAQHQLEIRKFPFSNWIPSYCVKPHSDR